MEYLLDRLKEGDDVINVTGLTKEQIKTLLEKLKEELPDADIQLMQVTEEEYDQLKTSEKFNVTEVREKREPGKIIGKYRDLDIKEI